uniref:(northern house mosquito) hypothetical protein n=1 Tax=Culex pipiens TaxID=7175 RepID=A0A8D8KUG6_CULPI
MVRVQVLRPADHPGQRPQDAHPPKPPEGVRVDQVRPVQFHLRQPGAAVPPQERPQGGSHQERRLARFGVVEALEERTGKLVRLLSADREYGLGGARRRRLYDSGRHQRTGGALGGNAVSHLKRGRFFFVL